uniref:J domain-containing protein n=1 Tax=Alexandrium monilatum TaxID=311494 RepID=A0A7S4QE34_9DINO|mmetsp:Transcript_88329/g.263447  ORF Transcript_88329/g.263447 Transcript_88329/m.263447 type:complete len:326 (+) Transcript_88329:52-1029(+)
MEVTELVPPSLRPPPAAPSWAGPAEVPVAPSPGGRWQLPLAGWKRPAEDDILGSVRPGDPRRAQCQRPAVGGSRREGFAEPRAVDFAFTAEAVASLAPDAAWVEGDGGGVVALPCAPAAHAQARLDPEAELLVAEVRRVTDVGGSDYRRVLDLHPGESWDMQVVQTRFRQLMRLLHPDKRSKVGEARAGGREICDEAVNLVLEALQAAKRELLGGDEQDPQRRAQQDMRRLQEVQRQRARQAMHRQQQSAAGKLAADIDRALAPQTEAAPSAEVPGRPDPTGREIAGLLARLNARSEVPLQGSQRCASGAAGFGGPGPVRDLGWL